jgi:hypothetical protein
MPIGVEPKKWSDLFAQGESTSYDDLPAGNYNMVITKVDPHKAAKTSGTIAFFMEYTVEDGPNKSRRAFFRRPIYSSTNNVDISIWTQTMLFFGLDAQFWSTDPTDEQITAALTGQRFNVDIDYKTGSKGGSFINFRYNKRLGTATTPATASAIPTAAATVASTPAPANSPAMTMPPLPPMS